MFSRVCSLNRLNHRQIWQLNSKLNKINQLISNRTIKLTGSSLSNCINLKEQNENQIKKYTKIIKKIRDELIANEKLDNNAEQLLIKLDLLCQEIKELEESFDKEGDQELKSLMKDDLSGLDAKFIDLKDDLIDLIYKESYLTDELTMEFENGVGGNEAMMFTKEMVDFYTQFCRRQNWTVNVVDLQSSNGN